MRRNSLVLAVGLLLALVLAGVLSFYASGSPDGLNRVAEDLGFSASEREPATAGAPFAGYGTRGVENDRLSGGLAGVTGVLLTLGIAGGSAWLLRARGRTDRRRTDRWRTDRRRTDRRRTD